MTSPDGTRETPDTPARYESLAGPGWEAIVARLLRPRSDVAAAVQPLKAWPPTGEPDENDDQSAAK